MSDSIITANVKPTYGVHEVVVHHFPEETKDNSPVWLRVSAPGSSMFACLTLAQAQELSAGLQRSITECRT